MMLIPAGVTSESFLCKQQMTNMRSSEVLDILVCNNVNITVQTVATPTHTHTHTCTIHCLM